MKATEYTTKDIANDYADCTAVLILRSGAPIDSEIVSAFGYVDGSIAYDHMNDNTKTGPHSVSMYRRQLDGSFKYTSSCTR